jgi:DNA replication protein DnaC
MSVIRETPTEAARPPSSPALEVAIVREECKLLRLPTVAAHCERLAAEAVRERHTHLRFLDALLSVELEEREGSAVARRLKEAHLPRLKTLEEFDFSKAPRLSATQIVSLSAGGYLEKCEPVLFLGECGTGKTHLATGLCVAACRQRKRVRFTSAAGLVNELLEAQHDNQLSRALLRWSRYDLICIDELGYVPLVELGTELLFQVISERAERSAVMITTNLPFSEWTQVFTNARLCKALLDRLTDRAHIIETGGESYRFRRTLDRTRDRRPMEDIGPMSSSAERPEGPKGSPGSEPEGPTAQPADETE